MNPRSDRPELPGHFSNLERMRQGTGVSFGTVTQTKNVNGRQLFDVRGDAGEAWPNCEAIGGAPADGHAWVNVRVVYAMTTNGHAVILGPLSGSNPALTDSTPSHDESHEHPGQFGDKDRVIEHSGIRIVMGANPPDLLLDVPGILRIQANGVRFSKGGDTGDRLVLWSTFHAWATEVASRLAAIDAWLREYEALILAQAPAPTTPPTVTTAAVTPTTPPSLAPTTDMAAGTISVPEEGLP